MVIHGSTWRYGVGMVRIGESIFVFNVEERDPTLVLRMNHTVQCFQVHHSNVHSN